MRDPGVRALVEDESMAGRLADLAATLGQGVAPSDLATKFGAASVLAAITREALSDDGPPLVRSAPRRPELTAAAGDSALSALFPRAPRPSVLSLSAGLLQILDMWDASHEAAQEADDLGEEVFAPYWHGIAHRREPDPGNAAYWFRRVGPHRVFAEVSSAAERLSGGREPPFVRGGVWDPIAFVGYCGSARRGTTEEGFARRIQAAEMLALLDATAAGIAET